MEVLLGTAAAVLIGAVAYTLFSRRARGATVAPAATPAAVEPHRPDIRAVKRGDAITFWNGTDATVLGRASCRETIRGRSTVWEWIFLSRDRVLEVLPTGMALYDGQAVAQQGSALYEMLVGAGGALKRFEGNVREGIAHEPIHVDIDETRFRVRATGTFLGQVEGEPHDDAREVWSSMSTNADENVYFKMVEATDEEGGAIALGIWTSHILILLGRRIARDEISDILAAG
ncbi:MAG: hypothetical protein FJ033_05410 [Chloroflexi bacterium]|nr:hypothetical protein [Chloroflexota bacterium]